MLPNAAATIRPDVTVQNCVVHLIRAAMKPIHATPSRTAAETAFAAFADAWGQKYPGVIATWQRAWNELIPFLDFPVGIRRVIYMTNQIESINYRLSKVTKNRDHFPNDNAAIKLRCLELRSMSPERGGDLRTGTYG